MKNWYLDSCLILVCVYALRQLLVETTLYGQITAGLAFGAGIVLMWCLRRDEALQAKLDEADTTISVLRGDTCDPVVKGGCGLCGKCVKHFREMAEKLTFQRMRLIQELEAERAKADRWHAIAEQASDDLYLLQKKLGKPRD